MRSSLLQKSRSFAVWPLLAVVLIACQPNTPTTVSSKGPYPAGADLSDQASEKDLLTPLPPSGAPNPSPGKAALSGALFSYTIQRLIPKTMFYLTAAEGTNHDSMPLFIIGPDPGKGDIISRSDAIGNFRLDAIPPGNYFLIVSAPYNWSPAETSPNDPTPLLIRLNVGDRLALGIVYFSWP